MQEIFKIIIYSGVIQGLFLAILISHSHFKNPANRYLSVLLFILSFSIIHSTFIIPYLQKFHGMLLSIKEPFILMVVPLLWLYVKKLEDAEFKLTIKIVLHFIPFMVIMLFNAFILFIPINITTSDSFIKHNYIVNLCVYIAVFSQLSFYINFIFKLITKFKIKTQNELSNTERFDLNWMRTFLFILFAVLLLLVLMFVIAIHNLKFDNYNTLLTLLFTAIIYILGYKGIFQRVLQPNPELDFSNSENNKTSIKTENPVNELLLNNLISHMQHERPFCDPELTLTSLAQKINTSRNQLSEIINSGTGSNFYEFVNKYRVEEVKKLMDNNKYKDFTLLAIAFEAGFPSKSTFNSIFKKYTGFTPREYKNQINLDKK